MTFGKELKDKFKLLSKGKRANEVTLFTTLLDAFLYLSVSNKSYDVAILHQHDGQVKHENSTIETKRKRATNVVTAAGKTCEITKYNKKIEIQCELSDSALVFILKMG